MKDSPEAAHGMSLAWRRAVGMYLGWATFVGTALGLVAFLVDLLPRDGGLLLALVAVFTTGLGWGAAALLLGAQAVSARWASLGGAVLLAVATVTYYALIVVTGTRADVGVSPQLRAAAIWGAVSLVGGPALGALGWLMRRGSAVQAALSAGGLGGLLAAQGVTEAVTNSTTIFAWPLPLYSLIVLLVVVVPAAGAVWWGHRHGRLALAVAALAVAGVAGAAGWATVAAVLR
ncbi:MAG: hypothetical protein ACRCXL_16070 [Dermatophilaceae bacterium]